MLTGKTFVITGATGALGKSATLSLAKAGARLILIAKSQDKLKDLAKHLISRAKVEPLLAGIDFLTLTPVDVEDFFSDVHTFTNSLDGLIHLAGIAPPMTPIANLSAKDTQNVWQINYHAKFLLTQKALPLLRRSAQSKIVFCEPKLHDIKPFHALEHMIGNSIETLCQSLNAELKQTNIQAECLRLPAVNSAYRQKGYPYEPRDKNIDPHELSALWVALMNDANFDANVHLSQKSKQTTDALIA